MQNNPVNIMIVISALIFNFFSLSCKTTRTIFATQQKELVNQLKVGDRVQVTTYSGEQHRFRIVHLSKNAIEGKETKIAFSEINFIEKDEIDTKKTFIFVAIVVVIISVVALLMFAT
jgi:hypothetical protein